MRMHILNVPVVLAGMMATPALADCVDELRAWQNEETRINAMQFNNNDLAGDMMSLDTAMGPAHPTNTACAYVNLSTLMNKHQAAYYRHCEPGIEGEKKAHEAEQNEVMFLSTSRKAQCPAPNDATNTVSPSSTTQRAVAPTTNAALRVPKGVNCNRPDGTVEYVICDSAELLDAEAKLEHTYRDAREVAGDSVRDDERAWVKNSMINCGVAGRGRPAPSQMAAATNCIMASVEQRTEELRRIAGN